MANKLSKPAGRKRLLEQKEKALQIIAGQIAICKICKKDKIGLPVPGEGNPDADIVFIGEAPGKEEAKTGRPFIGRAGKLLRTLIKEAGLNDQDVYITSPVKYLPKYITPTPADIAHGREHLMRQLDIIEPKVIVLMGNTAARALLLKPMPITQAHGKIFEEGGRKYFLAFHPAAALHNPNNRPLLVNDFKKLKIILKTIQK